jgi:CBS domain-containing protein
MLRGDDVPVLGPDERLADVAPELGNGIGRALVVDDGRLVGMLSVSDLVRALEAGTPRRPRRPEAAVTR